MRHVLLTVLGCGIAAASCQCGEPPLRSELGASEPRVTSTAGEGGDHQEARQALVNALRAQGIRDRRVLSAIESVPRHRMVPDALESQAYVDSPLPIGHDQTISQPYIVARMSELAEIEPGDKVLEIGTGSGYQAAVLAELGAEVYSIEIVPELGERTRALLDRLGYDERIHTRIGDGYAGWPSEAPFSAILLTAAPPAIPEPLKEQLAVGGKLVAPVGRGIQELVVLTKTPDGLEQTSAIPVRFVPMTGRAQELDEQ